MSWTCSNILMSFQSIFFDVWPKYINKVSRSIKWHFVLVKANNCVWKVFQVKYLRVSSRWPPQFSFALSVPWKGLPDTKPLLNPALYHFNVARKIQMRPDLPPATLVCRMTPNDAFTHNLTPSASLSLDGVTIEHLCWAAPQRHRESQQTLAMYHTISLMRTYRHMDPL